jgi:glycosyltransferase involved in cell wall biosynthesis
VVFHGHVSHSRVLELLDKADLFVFPTRSSEGFPKAVLEALACGLPVVTTKVSVLPNLIQRGCGVLVDDDHPETIAAAVAFCLSDPQRYREMSASALAVASEFSLERWRDTIGEHLSRAWGPLKAGHGTQPA